MDLDELKKMTVPKLRERAKEIGDLQGVSGMKKGDLIKAIAKAEEISLDAGTKVSDTISSVKEEVHNLIKQKKEIFSTSPDRSKMGRLRKKIRRLKRQTRQMAKEAARLKAVQQAQAAASEAAAKASTSAPAPAPEGVAAPEGSVTPESTPEPETNPTPSS